MRGSPEDAAEALDALSELGFEPQVAFELEETEPDLLSGPIYFLELDQDELEGEFLRPHLHPVAGGATGFPPSFEPPKPLPEWLRGVEIELDPLTIMGDRDYLRRLVMQPNLPDHVKTGVLPFYVADPMT